MKIKLGFNVDTSVDLEVLITSRMMILANSGGGKTHTSRRFIEQAFGHKQIIVIDPEGEYGNLREEYDFVYIAKDGGDAPAEVRSAALLARRLLETKASAIIDIYELGSERSAFVKAFFDACVDMPKNLWQDCFFLLDEAHKFAPEKGQGESVALQSVIDMASLGRKRGYCLIPMTQRPSKLSKDVVAECNNKLIGRASLDIDRERSAKELGFRTKEDILSLRDLEPGEFYVFGPAISRDVVKTKIGEVKVKPPKRGVRATRVPPPTAAVKKILLDLADLPEAAAEEARTVAELKTENANLKRQLKVLPSPKQVQSDPREIERIVKLEVSARDRFWKNEVAAWRDIADRACKIIHDGYLKVEAMKMPEPPVMTHVEPHRTVPSPILVSSRIAAAEIKMGQPVAATPKGYVPSIDHSEGDLSGPEQRILDAIALSESIGINEPEQTAVAFLAGYTYGGGGFNNPRGALKTKGLVEYRGARIALTYEGRGKVNMPTTPLTREMMREKVMSILPGPERKLLGPLMDAYPDAMTNEQLAEMSGYTNGSGGFNNPKGRLRTLGLIEYPSSGHSRARSLLFPD